MDTFWETNKKNMHPKAGLHFLNLIHFCLALFVLAWMNNGFFSYISPYFPGFLRWLLYIAWLGLAVMKSGTYFSTLIKHTWPLVLFIAYISIVSFFSDEMYLSIYISSFFYLVFIYSIFLYYFQKGYTNFLKVIIVYIFTEYIFLAINSFIKLQQNPLLSRILTADSGTIESNLGISRLAGVGTYAYFYSAVAIIISLFFLLFYTKLNKIIVMVSLVLFIGVLIKSSFTLALLFTIIFTLILLLIRFTKNPVFTIPFLSLIIIMLQVNGYFVALFVRLSKISFISPEVSIRFLEIVDFLSGKKIEGSDLASRLDLYNKSLQAFGHHILTGTSLFKNTIYIAGDHSAWLDLLARFGLVSILLFIFLYKVYAYTMKSIAPKYKVLVRIYWIYFIILGIVNTLFFASIFVVWILFLPIAISVIQKKTE